MARTAAALLAASLAACRPAPAKVAEPPSAARAACLASGTPESLVASQNRRLLMSAKPSLVSYFACQEGSGPACGALAGWTKDGEPLDRSCRERYYEARFIRAALEGRADPKACADYLDNTDGCPLGRYFKKDDYAFICGRLGEALIGRSGVDQACAELIRRGACTSGMAQHCRDSLLFAQGRPELCGEAGRLQGPQGGLGFEQLKRACRDDAFIVRALKAKDPAACGDSEFCRAFLGGPGPACPSDGRLILESYCTSVEQAGRERS